MALQLALGCTAGNHRSCCTPCLLPVVTYSISRSGSNWSIFYNATEGGIVTVRINGVIVQTGMSSGGYAGTGFPITINLSAVNGCGTTVVECTHWAAPPNEAQCTVISGTEDSVIDAPSAVEVALPAKLFTVSGLGGVLAGLNGTYSISCPNLTLLATTKGYDGFYYVCGTVTAEHTGTTGSVRVTVESKHSVTTGGAGNYCSGTTSGGTASISRREATQNASSQYLYIRLNNCITTCGPSAFGGECARRRCGVAWSSPVVTGSALSAPYNSSPDEAFDASIAFL